MNIDIEHGDFWEWLEIREPKGDVNRQSLNLHQCVIVPDGFMQKVQEGDPEARKRWIGVLRKRKATGEPYVSLRVTLTEQIQTRINRMALKFI